ncbi:MAG: zinc-binding alcohol dehydrogenase [Steroidobacteraceae bacterium]
MTRIGQDLAKAFWVAAPGRGEIRTEAAPRVASGEAESGLAIVQALYSAVSRGTESLVFRGAVPESERQRMRAPFQQGDFPGPVKYGYSSVGRVIAGPDALVGREAFCLHPHQDFYAVPASALQVLPEGVPAARAVLAANLETAINAIWDAGVLPGDRVAVVGAGSVGCLCAWLAGRIPGCEVELIDIQPGRSRIADWLGVRFAVPADARGEADVVLHASATSAGLQLALGLAAFEARVLELSWYGEGEQHVSLGGAFHAQRLQLRSSQVGRVATAQRARWDYARRLQLALRLLSASALDVLITSEGTLDELPAKMAELAQAPGDSLVHRVRYE